MQQKNNNRLKSAVMLLLLLLVSLGVSAQSAVSAAGGGVINATGSLQYTMGQTAYGSAHSVDGQHTLNEGVQQPYPESLILRDTVLADVCYGVSTAEAYRVSGFFIPFDSVPQAGSYHFNRTFVSSRGYDSIVTLILVVHPSGRFEVRQEACDSFYWNGEMLYASAQGLQHHSISDFGCDSLTVLDLTMYHSTHTNAEANAVDSFHWHGTLLTQSGYYNATFQTSHGCDSTVTLKLILAGAMPPPHIVSYDKRAVMLDHFPLGEDSMRVDYLAYRWYCDDDFRPQCLGDVYTERQGNEYKELSGCFYVEVPTDSTLRVWVRSNTICLTPSTDTVDEDDVTFGIYPNPAPSRGQLHVDLHGSWQESTVSVYDLLGRQLQTGGAVTQTVALDLNLVSGTYIIAVRNKQGHISSRKFIVR